MIHMIIIFYQRPKPLFHEEEKNKKIEDFILGPNDKNLQLHFLGSFHSHLPIKVRASVAGFISHIKLFVHKQGNTEQFRDYKCSIVQFKFHHPVFFLGSHGSYGGTASTSPGFRKCLFIEVSTLCCISK